jgi:hypothetical protein
VTYWHPNWAAHRRRTTHAWPSVGWCWFFLIIPPFQLILIAMLFLTLYYWALLIALWAALLVLSATGNLIAAGVRGVRGRRAAA